jgi:hypothetical protein
LVVPQKSAVAYKNIIGRHAQCEVIPAERAAACAVQRYQHRDGIASHVIQQFVLISTRALTDHADLELSQLYS